MPTPTRIVRHSTATDPQRRFWASRARFRAFIGGVGSGKTRAGVVEAFRQPAGSTGMILAPTYRMLEDATLDTFLELANRARILVDFNHKRMRARLMGNRTVLFRSTEKPDRLRGPNLGWFAMDEAALSSRTAYQIMLGRLRLAPAVAWFMSSPRGKATWLYKVFEQGGGDFYRVRASTRTNTFLPPEFADTLASEYDLAFSQQEIEGEDLDDATGQLLPESWVERMARAVRDTRRPPGLKAMAIDLGAGTGRDRTVCMIGDLMGIEAVYQSSTVGPREAALEAHRLSILHNVPGTGERIVYDDGGTLLGREFDAHLTALGIPDAVPYHGSASGGEKYANRRTFAFFQLRERLTPDLPLEPLATNDSRSAWDLPRRRPVPLQAPFVLPTNDPLPDWWPALKEELTALRYEMKGRKKALQPKEQMAAALRRSPDLADALGMLTWLIHVTL